MAATSRRMPRGNMPQRVRTRVLALLDDDLDLPPNCKQAAELVVRKAKCGWTLKDVMVCKISSSPSLASSLFLPTHFTCYCFCAREESRGSNVGCKGGG